VAILIKSCFVVVLGTLLGLALTFVSLERGFGFGAVRAGPWTGWPKTGSADIDPYARAVLSRSGAIPLGTGEGISFIARADSDGAPLNPKCDYSLKGPMPPARFWTLSVFSPNGALIENPAKRYGFTSAEILRASDMPAEIVLASTAHAGNWLPTPSASSYVVVLRLYDSVLSATAASLDSSVMPKLVRGLCR
jgi:hypothetical protein